MKFYNLVGFLIMFVHVGCSSEHLNNSSDLNTEITTGQEGGELRIRMENAGFELIEAAYANTVLLTCGDESKTVSFSAESQSAIFYVDLSECFAELLSFTIVDQGDVEHQYNLTDDSVEGFSVFEKVGTGGEVADVRLVRGGIDYSSYCSVSSGGCAFGHIEALFRYSEIQSEEIVLENDLDVTSFNVGVELEPAPDCNIDVRFEQDDTFAEPELVLTLGSCANLLASEMVEFSFSRHSGKKDYGITALHDGISAFGGVFSGAAPSELRFSVEDLLSALGTSDVFGALTADYLFAIRNEDGMSIRYFVIQNSCEILVVGNQDESPTANPTNEFEVLYADSELSECETAYGFGDTRFDQLDVRGNRWGWQISVSPDDVNSSVRIYAGAGGYNLSAAADVGELRYFFDGSDLSGEIRLASGYYLKESHFYVGSENLVNTAPGRYGNTFEYQPATNYDNFSFEIVSANSLKLVMHAKVCIGTI